MGVPGLWELLRPAAARTSLSSLAKEAFLANRHGLRGLTVGIDASIWIFHAQTTQAGENPFLRTIFFKISALLQHPVLPVFVFDGPNKPAMKRKQTVAGHFGTNDWQSRQFKQLLDICGLEWWNAPGEAEAELALMNRQGKIDVVLSDDADALLFGAKCLLRNNSPTLSGSKASASTQANPLKSDGRQYEIYRASAIREKWIAGHEGTKLATEDDCRLAMVFVALLGGGDYVPEGVPTFGATIASALAHAGCSGFLRDYSSNLTQFQDSLPNVKNQIIEELRSNASGFIGRRYKSRADDLSQIEPDQIFPQVALNAYLTPSTSGEDLNKGWPGFGKGERGSRRGLARNTGRGDLEGMARACEKFFEWGTKDLVYKKFAGENSLFKAAILDYARNTAMLPSPSSPSTHSPSHDSTLEKTSQSHDGRLTSYFRISKIVTYSQPVEEVVPSFITRIYSTRPDPSQPDLPELRLGFIPSTLANRCRAAMEGHRVDPKDLDQEEREQLGLVDKEGDIDGEKMRSTQIPIKEEIRIWIPEYLVQEVWPELITAYQLEKAEKLKSPRKPKKTVISSVQTISHPKSKAATLASQNGTTLFSMGFVQRLPRRDPSSSPLTDVGEDFNRASSDSELSTCSRNLRVIVTTPGGGEQKCGENGLGDLIKRTRSDLSSSGASARSLSSPPPTLGPPTSRTLDSSSSIRRPKTSKLKRSNIIQSIANPSSTSQSTEASPRAGPFFPRREFQKVRSAPESSFVGFLENGQKSRQTSVVSSGSGSKDEPIDLCSDSDDDVVPKSIVRVPSRLGGSPQKRTSPTVTRPKHPIRTASSPPSASSKDRTTGVTPSVSTTGTTVLPSSRQVRLDSMFTQRKPISLTTKDGSRQEVVVAKVKSRKQDFVITSSTDDVEYIDLRKARRWS